ncbi:hypothetical protein P3T76_004179 [Phytophthora citrophthora]|uniref:Uncharacterized protein n=1 Tax=Phytophthora citrophthora TaxID=4793 RepID=A0AAD9GT55_9STRA|nr:hypothetical protein P3T76_004179 [Phytophthora citrophthora]
MALIPIWVVVDATQWIEITRVMYFALAVLVVLYTIFLVIDFPLATGIFLFVYLGASSLDLFFTLANAITALVKTDVKLANFVTTEDSEAHDPDECQHRFGSPDLYHGGSPIQRIYMPRRIWLAAIYFAVIKVAISLLSAVVLAISIALPAFVLFNGGEVSLVDHQFKFSDTPITYTALAITIWLVGIAGVSVVAVLSVKATFWVCDVGQQQLEVEAQAIPSSEVTTTNFVKVEISTPVEAAAVV